ncbi:MAG: hypothetical protein RL375_4061 [Pseudomonadota bacterium]|jgi:PAS domain S-box-containing protein
MTTPTPHKPLIARLQRLAGWRLWALFSLGAVVGVEIIVSIMDLALMGTITADYLITGLVAAGIVAPVSLYLLTALLRDIGDRDHLEQMLDVQSGQARSREALKESRNLLQAIIDEVPVRVFWKDSELRYLGCNPAFARDAGFSHPDELIGKTDFEMGWAEQADRYRADDLAVMASGQPRLSFDEPQTTPAGQTHWLRTSKVPLRNSAHQTVGILGIYEDVTEWRRVTDMLHQREQYQRALLDNFPFMVWLKDEQSRFLAVNEAFAKVFGWPSAESLIGRSDLDIAPAELAERYRADDQAVLLSGRPKHVEELIETAGRRTWFETYKSPVSMDGRIIGTVGFGRDITERKQSEAELEGHRRHLQDLVEQRSSELLATEARATRILDSAADGLYGVDSHSRITFINAAACRMLGYTPEQVMGLSAHELFHHSHPDGSAYPAEQCMARQAWRSGRETRVDDETYWHADGHPVPVALASHPIIERGQVVGAVVSIVDVSAQRAAAQAREQALVAAENLARARSEFLANMSHEIRTPMNGVLGFAHIGRRHHHDADKARNAFDKILDSGKQLLSIVNEILDFSKIDAGKLQIESTELSLGDVLDGAMQLVADRARARGLDLRLVKADDLPTTCIGDPLRLGQVLLNLLTNAIKFTETGSVTVSALLRQGQLVFRVADTGIGMTAHQLGTIFNPFQQADGSTTRRFGGTGLGLAICKRLAELMQGEITVDSTPGQGSTFELRLPYMAPAGQARTTQTATTHATEQSLEGVSILLAEDDEVNRIMLQISLQDQGARLVMVGDGAAAVQRLIDDGPDAYDIVLMDIQMPVMDGYEAARRIHALAPALPIVGQTAHAFDEDRHKCLAAGMAGHIAKPIDPHALTQLVLRVLAQQH